MTALELAAVLRAVKEIESACRDLREACTRVTQEAKPAGPPPPLPRVSASLYTNFKAGAGPTFVSPEGV